MDNFLHGIEVVAVDDGPRPVRGARQGVIGIVGTAPAADADVFPVNVPVLIAGSPVEAAKLDLVGDGAGTLPDALTDIFKQAGALVVVVRVEEGVDDAATRVNVIGGIDGGTGQHLGVHALLDAQSIVKASPKILIAPGFTSFVTRDVEEAITGAPVVSELIPIANRLRAHIIADGPDTTDAEAITFRELFTSRRVIVLDPHSKVYDAAADEVVVQPSSSAAAGIFAKTRFSRSPSNQPIVGIVGTSRAVDFTMGDPLSRANLLNEDEVMTIIQEEGYRLWGNRTCSTDAVYAFIATSRTADAIDEALLQSHLWALARGVTKTYIGAVLEGVNDYLRFLKGNGDILGGSAWFDKDANPASQIEQGVLNFDFDFTPVPTAERIRFRRRIVNSHIEEIFG